MPSPFPGMDPYLEARQLWPDAHLGLIAAIRDALAPQVAPNYYVRIDQRTYIARVDRQDLLARPYVAVISVPDAPEHAGRGGLATVVVPATQTVTLPRFERVREGYLEIHDTRTHEVVTAIELLSPANKRPGAGREEYETKRRQVLLTLTSLVEIDLLRSGEPMEMEPLPQSDFRILVAAGWERPRARLIAFSVRHALPEVSVPLRQGEQEARLALGAVLADLYDRARYDLRLDYQLPLPEPTVSQEDAAWIDELLRARGLRAESRGNRAAGP